MDRSESRHLRSGQDAGGRNGLRRLRLVQNLIAFHAKAAAMKYRELGRTGWKVSEISFGAWAIGGAWDDVDDRESLAALHRAVDLGVNFFDTADVYGDGRSERLLARLKRERSEEIIVATKAGRRLEPHVASGYTR